MTIYDIISKLSNGTMSQMKARERLGNIVSKKDERIDQLEKALRDAQRIPVGKEAIKAAWYLDPAQIDCVVADAVL